MDTPFDLIPVDGLPYRLSDAQLLEAYEFLLANRRSGVPRSEFPSRREEVIAFLDRRRKLSELIRFNRLLREADDPIADLTRGAGSKGWPRLCWPTPVHMLELGMKSQKLAATLGEYVPCLDDADFKRFEFVSGGHVRLTVLDHLLALDYLFHGRTLNDREHDRKLLQGIPIRIQHWLVAAPGSCEVPHTEEELWLGRCLVLAGGNAEMWPASFLQDYDAIWEIYVVLKHQFGDLPVFAINSWSNEVAKLREEVQSLPLVPPAQADFWRRMFPDGLRREPVRHPPPAVIQLRSDADFLTQEQKLKQVRPDISLPLIRRSWISNLQRHARSLEVRLRQELSFILDNSVHTPEASEFIEVKPISPHVDDAAEVGPPPNSPEGGPPLLEFVPGGFVYAGMTCDLRGKPRLVLEYAARARLQRISFNDAAKEIWDPLYSLEPNTFSSAVAKVRRALRTIVGADTDPFLCVDGGNNLAYQLNVPFVLPQPPEKPSS